MTDKEFLEVYLRIDNEIDLDHNSAEVEAAVAKETGLSGDEVWDRVHRIFHAGDARYWDARDKERC